MKLALTFFALSLLVTGCGRHDQSQPIAGDALLQRKLVGKWHLDRRDGGHHFTSATTIASNGNYVCQVSSRSSAGVQTVAIEGVFAISNGFLIDTQTKRSNTDAVMPQTERARINRFDDQELVVQWESSDVESVFRKDAK